MQIAMFTSIKTKDDIPRCLAASSEPQSPVLRASTSCHLHSLVAGVLLRMLCASPHLTAEPSCLCLQQWNAANHKVQKRCISYLTMSGLLSARNKKVTESTLLLFQPKIRCHICYFGAENALN